MQILVNLFLKRQGIQLSGRGGRSLLTFMLTWASLVEGETAPKTRPWYWRSSMGLHFGLGPLYCFIALRAQPPRGLPSCETAKEPE